MTNEYGEDDDRNFEFVQRASSVDSLELTERENLRFISGYQQWINSNENYRVQKLIDHHQQQRIDLCLNESHTINDREKNVSKKKCSNEEEDEQSLSQMDISFDIHLQVNHGQLQSNMPAKVFSSNLENINLTPNNLPVCTSEMDMENGEKHNGKSNGYSRNNNNNNNNNYYQYQQSDRINRRQNDDGNSNRNNNNSRRSNEDDDDNDDDDDDDDDDGSEENDDHSEEDDNEDDDDETDEEIARRLNFLPIDSSTITVIGRLRNLTTKKSFEQQDFEIFQSLIDELIRLQHLENFSREQLKDVVHHLKLYRPLRTKSRAFIFLGERIPRRAVKYQVIASNQSHSTNTNVFNIWRERERRARLDSRDSLEDEGHTLGGQQLRDVIEINHPTPPIFISTTRSSPIVTTKVKQMAKDIDTRSTSTRSEINVRTGERFSDHAFIPRSSSPVYPGLVSVALYDVKTPANQKIDDFLNENSNSKRLIHPTNSIPPLVSEASHVRKMIDRLESSSTRSSSPSSSDMNKTKKITIKKSIPDDHSDGSTSWTASPPVKRLARSDFKEKNFINENINLTSRTNDTTDETPFRTSVTTDVKLEVKRDDTSNLNQRTTSGTTIEEYVTSLLPGTETSVSIVRDVRTRLYDNTSAVSRTDLESIPVKVDVETLYILEQKSDKKSPSPVINVYIPDYEYKHKIEHQDFGVQTTTPTTIVKPPHRPIGTQVDSIIEQHTIGLQTTDSLHRPSRERQRLPTPPVEEEEEEIKRTTTTTTTTRYEIKRRHSSYTSDDGDNNDGAAVIYIDNKSKKSDFEDNFQLKREKHHSETDEQLPVASTSHLRSFGQIASRIRIDQLRDINRHVVRRHLQETESHEDEHRSNEVYEIHTRGACKCLVVSYEEKAQYGAKTRFEKQLERIERTYTDIDLQATELHVIVTTSDSKYQLVKRDYGQKNCNDDEKENENSLQPTTKIHYYNKDGHRMRTEHVRPLEQLPLVIRSEIEYELNHYGSAQLIILSVTNNERRQMNTSLKKELVEEIVSRSGGRLSPDSPELEQEITRQLSEPTTLLHLVDYSSRDNYNQTNSTDLRRVSRIDVTTSLRLVQRYRTVIHRLCQLYRSHLRLTHQAEQQRHLILVSRDEYYFLDLTTQNSGILANISDIRQRQHDIFKREVNNVIQQPFDYAKYRRETAQQQRIIEQQYRQGQMEYRQHKQQHKVPPPPGHPSEAEFYLGSQRRVLIEREIHSMREAIRPHENAPPRYKREPRHRSLSISYTGAQRYVRARIIHVKDFYDDNYQYDRTNPRLAKEQELFIRVDDYVNESAANSLRRSYSTDYLSEDGPRSRIRYIRIPGETVKIEEKITYEYKGVMYADLPYSLRYWNILSILDREARQGRPLGSTLPQVIVNDPYRTVIPPLTQQEIRQTAQQILSPQYNARSYTDQTLRWFLSRDNRTEIESAKYLQTLNQYQAQKQQSQTQKHVQQGIENKCYVTEKLVHYQKLPDRLVPLKSNHRAQSQENFQHRSPSIPRILHPPNLPANSFPRSQSQPRPSYPSGHGNIVRTTQHCSPFSPMQSPLSRHQSVHELYAPSTISHPPSPSPSLRSLHHHPHYRRPVSYNNRTSAPKQNPLFTEIIDSQTGQRILTTSQEQLPSEVLGLLNKYNLQQF